MYLPAPTSVIAKPTIPIIRSNKILIVFQAEIVPKVNTIVARIAGYFKFRARDTLAQV